MKLVILFFSFLFCSQWAFSALHPKDDGFEFFQLSHGESVIEQYRFKALNKNQTRFLMIGYVRVKNSGSYSKQLGGNLFRFSAEVTRGEKGFWSGQGSILVAFGESPEKGSFCKYPIDVASIKETSGLRRTYVRTAKQIGISRSSDGTCPSDKKFNQLESEWSDPAWFKAP